MKRVALKTKKEVKEPEEKGRDKEYRNRKTTATILLETSITLILRHVK